MAQPLTFLIVASNEDSLTFLVATLRKKFPTSVCTECSSLAAASAALSQPQTAGIVHHATDAGGLRVVEALRAQAPEMPIVFMATADAEEAGRAAGADAFLPYDDWLQLGTVVAQVLIRSG
jgi:CheY-like chemotaxis protein